MSEKKSQVQDSLDMFLSGIKDKDVEHSASMEIHPKVYVHDVGIENSKTVKVLSEPYVVVIPEEKAMSDDNSLLFMDVEYLKVKHQFICQAKSFRYQYAVIMKQLGFKKTEFDKMIGAVIKIWLELVELEKWGKQKLYQVSLVAKPPKK